MRQAAAIDDTGVAVDGFQGDAIGVLAINVSYVSR
jgi:hypothetical protein